ncbi:MAG: NAD(P)H-dependent oxidoreductase subunit E [Caldisericaceae bacterium]
MKEHSLIDSLHELQDADRENFIKGKDAISVARKSKLPLSKVYGVATFYTMFSVYPRGKHIIRVCNSLSCHMAKAEDIVEKLKEVLGVEMGETTPDKEFTLEESSCLGMCSVSPAMMIDDMPFGNLSTDDIPLILEKVREGKL